MKYEFIEQLHIAEVPFFLIFFPVVWNKNIGQQIAEINVLNLY